MAVITRSATVETGTHQMSGALRPIAVDVALPLLAYYTAHSVLGLSLVDSLVLGSVVPAVRAGHQLLRERSLNGLATLMLVVNLLGIGLSLVAGDPRLMIAKDGAVSSVIGLAMIGSVFAGRPMMTAGMRPFVVKRDAGRDAAWDRLAATSVTFRRLERSFTLVWGSALVAECAAKVVGAYTLPLDTMVWLGTVFLVGAIVLAIAVGNFFAGRMAELVIEESKSV
ncbi:VC0807 family protein [Kitasatospora sp. MAP5-34]|uniref:VC0807 family protein n=1 Tax=Kitasatospora sp. MAP5-34 TaxID=3035102 RepID=UPI0024741AF2|nr:VC0807 family protein [Kitasatospora sp. MAP5-34]MDH6576458.1 intracellular septation protein A [Kitasatospora sp. MAP5-34]